MVRRILSPEREAELLAIWPHHSDAELARRFGLNVRQAQYLGFKHGLNKTAATRSASRRNRDATGEALTVRVERVVGMAGATGMTRAGAEAALSHESPSSICTALNKLTASRRLHRTGSNGRSRWFASAADAATFAQAQLEQRHAVAPAPQPHPKAPVVRIAQSLGPARQPGELVITEHTRKTVGAPMPGPEGRWHSNAAPHFTKLKPGRYSEAASDWVQAITRKQA